MRGYEFADPSIVRAYYDPAVPLQERNMLLKLQALGIARLYVGVRVSDVYEEDRESEGRRARIWGWGYRTLEGHVERGQMDWQVWKWLTDGQVEFRVRAVSRPAAVRNLFVWLGFRLVRERERRAFLDSTKQRMLTFTELALCSEASDQAILTAAARLTVHSYPDDDDTHVAVARNLGREAG